MEPGEDPHDPYPLHSLLQLYVDDRAAYDVVYKFVYKRCLQEAYADVRASLVNFFETYLAANGSLREYWQATQKVMKATLYFDRKCKDGTRDVAALVVLRRLFRSSCGRQAAGYEECNEILQSGQLRDDLLADGSVVRSPDAFWVLRGLLGAHLGLQIFLAAYPEYLQTKICSAFDVGLKPTLVRSAFLETQATRSTLLSRPRLLSSGYSFVAETLGMYFSELGHLDDLLKEQGAPGCSIAHFNTAHFNTAHSNTAHFNNAHSNTAHFNNAHLNNGQSGNEYSSNVAHGTERCCEDGVDWAALQLRLERHDFVVCGRTDQRRPNLSSQVNDTHREITPVLTQSFEREVRHRVRDCLREAWEAYVTANNAASRLLDTYDLDKLLAIGLEPTPVGLITKSSTSKVPTAKSFGGLRQVLRRRGLKTAFLVTNVGFDECNGGIEGGSAHGRRATLTVRFNSTRCGARLYCRMRSFKPRSRLKLARSSTPRCQSPAQPAEAAQILRILSRWMALSGETNKEYKTAIESVLQRSLFPTLWADGGDGGGVPSGADLENSKDILFKLCKQMGQIEDKLQHLFAPIQIEDIRVQYSCQPVDDCSGHDQEFHHHELGYDGELRDRELYDFTLSLWHGFLVRHRNRILSQVGVWMLRHGVHWETCSLRLQGPAPSLKETSSQKTLGPNVKVAEVHAPDDKDTVGKWALGGDTKEYLDSKQLRGEDSKQLRGEEAQAAWERLPGRCLPEDCLPVALRTTDQLMSLQEGFIDVLLRAHEAVLNTDATSYPTTGPGSNSEQGPGAPGQSFRVEKLVLSDWLSALGNAAREEQQVQKLLGNLGIQLGLDGELPSRLVSKSKLMRPVVVRLESARMQVSTHRGMEFCICLLNRYSTDRYETIDAIDTRQMSCVVRQIGARNATFQWVLDRGVCTFSYKGRTLICSTGAGIILDAISDVISTRTSSPNSTCQRSDEEVEVVVDTECQPNKGKTDNQEMWLAGPAAPDWVYLGDKELMRRCGFRHTRQYHQYMAELLSVGIVCYAWGKEPASVAEKKSMEGYLQLNLQWDGPQALPRASLAKKHNGQTERPLTPSSMSDPGLAADLGVADPVIADPVVVDCRIAQIVKRNGRISEARLVEELMTTGRRLFGLSRAMISSRLQVLIDKEIIRHDQANDTLMLTFSDQ
ncbi:hypothetical protein GNI_118740 [Gregarina niphandrodes]|uniref:Cullin family protein n=1 Tax=Gregarina niphandrodes TaxID=110365 RepID=A0A023B2L0_GRENI|nr:hypothetical protein GNI_118740 [Gregarina niphandrodes]EZG55073.1 hypothetical protein GNI_118740 [Gregarina niphandrodes]|eukprot:XP_011131799.1 hypothetical protein GNI_118740 [Gregarina niphandrodes]